MKRQIITSSQVPDANHKSKGYRRKMRGYRRSDKLLRGDSSRRSDRQSAPEANHVADLHAQQESRCARWTRGPCFPCSSPQFGHKSGWPDGRASQAKRGGPLHRQPHIRKLKRGQDSETWRLQYPVDAINCVYPQGEREKFSGHGTGDWEEQGK